MHKEIFLSPVENINQKTPCGYHHTLAKIRRQHEKLGEDIKEGLINLLSSSKTRKEASQKIGISLPTLELWIRQNQVPNGLTQTARGEINYRQLNQPSPLVIVYQHGETKLPSDVLTGEITFKFGD